MSRIICNKCQRPEKTCICHLFVTVDNDVDVIILRHPKEANHSKGTAPLLLNSLTNSSVIEGEDFNDNDVLNNILSDVNRKCCLLYPSEQAIDITVFSNANLNSEGHEAIGSNKTCTNKISLDKISTEKMTTLILLDATWKKAYRMYMLSKNLQTLTHLVLPAHIESEYKIRKTSKENGLSTLEATVHALSYLEKSQNKYKELLENFVKFNQIQLSYKR